MQAQQQSPNETWVCALLVKGFRETSSAGSRMLVQEVPPCRATRGLCFPPNPVSHARTEACGTRSVVLVARSTHPGLAGALLGNASGRARAGAVPPQQTEEHRQLGKHIPARQRHAAQKGASRGVSSLLCRHERHWLRVWRETSSRFHHENTDPGTELLMGSSYSHGNSTSQLCSAWTYQSHPIPHS